MRLDLAKLGAISVRDLDGTPVRVQTAWAGGPAVLVFLRHFG
jgi:hypothetical protein